MRLFDTNMAIMIMTIVVLCRVQGDDSCDHTRAYVRTCVAYMRAGTSVMTYSCHGDELVVVLRIKDKRGAELSHEA